MVLHFAGLFVRFNIRLRIGFLVCIARTYFSSLYFVSAASGSSLGKSTLYIATLKGSTKTTNASDTTENKRSINADDKIDAEILTNILFPKRLVSGAAMQVSKKVIIPLKKFLR